MVESMPPSAVVYSQPIPYKIVNAAETLENVFGKGYAELEGTLIDHTLLKGWLSELIDEAEGNKRAVGQRLRGFSTFCIS